MINLNDNLSKLFKTITYKHAPIKQKKVRGNNASRENFVNMKKMKNKFNSICRKSKIKYLKKSTEKGISSSKQFWNFVKLFLTNKGCMSNDFISIRNGDAFIDKKSELMEMFNTHYINIVEKTSGVPPENYVVDTNNTQ